MHVRLRHAALAVATAFVLAACGKDAAPTTPLDYAPADSAYVFGNLERVPEATLDAWFRNAEAAGAMSESALDAMIDDLADDTPPPPGLDVLRAVREELRGKLTREGIASLGLRSDALIAAYGIGLAPVLRMELGDAAAFRAFVARIEQRSGQPFPTAKVGAQDYWKLDLPEGKAAAIAAIHGEHLVLTLAPAGASAASLENLLGLAPPERSAAEAGALSSMNASLGYTAYGSGYLDVERLFAALDGARTPLEQEFLAALGVTPEPPSAACKTEYTAIAANIPRVSFGYTMMTAQRMDLRYVVETSAAIGTDLATLPAPVPGLDGRGDGAFDFGIGLDLGKLAELGGKWAGQVSAAPYTCESLVELNQGFTDLRGQLANPGVFMAAPLVRGLLVSFTRFEMPEGGMPDVAGKVLLASPQPQQLLQLAAGFVEPLAGFAPAQGEVTPLPEGLLPAGTAQAHVLVAPEALALSYGAGEEATLAAWAGAASGDPPPLMHYSLSGAGIARLLGSALTSAEAELAEAEAALAEAGGNDAAPGADGDATDDMNGDEAADAEEPVDPAARVAEARRAIEALRNVQKVYAEGIGRIDVNLYATRRGIEGEYSVTLAP
jgi:hypothetical protein